MRLWGRQLLHARVLGHRGLHEHGDDGLKLDEFIQTCSPQEYGWQVQPKANSAHPQYTQVQALCQGRLHQQGGEEKLPELGDGCPAKKLV